MAKINNSDYPELSFTEAVRMLKQFHEKLSGKASSFSSLANAFDSSEKSGWFKVKVGDLRKYGLIEGRGEFKISDIGQDILFYNKKEEQQEAIKKVLNNIDLFKSIYERVGKDVQDISTFKAILGDITHAEKSVIQNKAEQIRNIYIDLVSNIDDGFSAGAIQKEDARRGQTQSRTKEDLPDHMINANIEDVYIEMPRTLESVDIAKQIIAILEKKIKSSSESKEKK